MVDTISPTPPRNLRVSPGQEGPFLHWDQSLDNVAINRYEVVRDGDSVGRVTPPESSFIDSDGPAGNHSYYVIAVDSSGNRSNSNTVSVTVEDLTTIFAPSNLNATVEEAAGGLQIRLIWNRPQNITNVVGYQVNRNNTELVRTGLLAYTDNRVDLNQTYTYFVRTYNLQGNFSAPSNSVQVNIQTTVRR